MVFLKLFNIQKQKCIVTLKTERAKDIAIMHRLIADFTVLKPSKSTQHR